MIYRRCSSKLLPLYVIVVLVERDFLQLWTASRNWTHGVSSRMMHPQGRN